MMSMTVPVDHVKKVRDLQFKPIYKIEELKNNHFKLTFCDIHWLWGKKDLGSIIVETEHGINSIIKEHEKHPQYWQLRGIWRVYGEDGRIG